MKDVKSYLIPAVRVARGAEAVVVTFHGWANQGAQIVSPYPVAADDHYGRLLRM